MSEIWNERVSRVVLGGVCGTVHEPKNRESRMSTFRSRITKVSKLLERVSEERKILKG